MYQVNNSLQDSYTLKLLDDQEVYQKEKKGYEKINGINGVVEIIDSFENEQYFGILMNLLKSSIEQINLEQTLSNSKIIGMIKQLTITIDEIHQKGILFTDLKPSNILVDNDNQLKVYLGQNWISKETINNQNRYSQQNLYEVSLDDIIQQTNQIQNNVNVINNYQRLGKIICFLIKKFYHNQIFDLFQLEQKQTEYIKQICIKFPKLISIICSILNDKNIDIDEIIDQLEQIHYEAEQKIFSFDEQFQESSTQLISSIYLTNNNINDEINLQIQMYEQHQIEIIQNQLQDFLQKIIKQIKHMNGENYQISNKDVIFYTNYLSFMNHKLAYSQQKSLKADNLEFKNNIKKKLQQQNRFDYLSQPDLPLYLLQKLYKKYNIQIKYTKSQNTNQKLNYVMEHFLFSGMIEDTYYMNLKLDNNENFNFQIVQNNPIILRNKLNELGLEDYMILNIYEGSVGCHLYPKKQVLKKIKNRTKETYHSFLDGQVLNISNLLSSSHNIYYTIDHFKMKQQFRGFVEIKQQQNKKEIIKVEKQPHNFPIGYYGIGLNVEKYEDKQFLKQTCENGVWITAFHGIKPYQEKHNHIRGIIENGFIISENITIDDNKDVMAKVQCRFKKINIGQGNIYFANSVRTDVQKYRYDNGGAEVYTLPIQINGNEYCIIFMCRLNPKKIYSPVSHPVQILAKENLHARPYRVLIMETIKDEQEINFNFQAKNKKENFRSNQKHYENETIEVLLSKLRNSNFYNPQKERLQILLQSNNVLELDNEKDKKKTFKQLIQGKKPQFIYRDPSNQIKTYKGVIVQK